MNKKCEATFKKDDIDVIIGSVSLRILIIKAKGIGPNSKNFRTMFFPTKGSKYIDGKRLGVLIDSLILDWLFYFLQ